MSGIDAPQFRRDEIECPRPIDGYEFVAPAPWIGAGTTFEPAAPDHRRGDPRPVGDRSRNVAEQRRRRRVPRMRHDLDVAVAQKHRKGAPMRAVRETSGGKIVWHVRVIRLVG
jgi:hypothetical protein